MTKVFRVSLLYGAAVFERNVYIVERDGVIETVTADRSDIGPFDRWYELNGLVTPPFVNAHTHLELTGERLPEENVPSRTLWDWITAVVKHKRGLNDGRFRHNIEDGAAALAAAGTAAAGDVRSVLSDEPVLGAGLEGRIFFEVLGYIDEVFSSRFEALGRFLGASAPSGVLPGISIHSLYTTPVSRASELIGLARHRGLPVMIHLAETTEEDRLLFSGDESGFRRIFPSTTFEKHSVRGYADVMDMLDMGPDCILVHCTRFTADDWTAAARRGVAVVFCPRSNEFWRDGAADVMTAAGLGIRWALGTDSCLTAPDLDVLEEGRALYRRFGGSMAAGILDALTYGGRRVLGMPGNAFAPGAPARFLFFPSPGVCGTTAPVFVLAEKTKPLYYTGGGGDELFEAYTV